MSTKAEFTIKNGPTFKGHSFGADKSVSGEAVFTTSLVGYPESMTDPSYRGQILVFTQPLIGNYGVPSMDVRDEYGLLRYFESSHIQVAGIVVADYAAQYSHWTAVESLGNWCKREGIVAITGVDTREIVQYLREEGSSQSRIVVDGCDEIPEFCDTMSKHLVAEVSTKETMYVPATKPTANIAVVDCGVKENIIRSLVSRGANVTIFPYNARIQDVAGQFDGVFLSNGPGNPEKCQETIQNLKELLNNKEYENLPIFGICLGHQLLALASGGHTHKLKYGNRAHNIPAMDLTTGQCHITSQNHGYAVDPESLPSDQWKPYFINLNDQSNEGMVHTERPIFSTQFHPEAKGGPLDTMLLFDKFFANIETYKTRQHQTTYKMVEDIYVDHLSKERILA